MKGFVKQYIFIFLICLILLTGCTTKNISPKVTPNISSNITGGESNLTVTFINVGQADSEWIVSPRGNTMLIDSGDSSDDVSAITSVIYPHKTIDIVVATHPHADHIGGMRTILNKYEISEFYDSGYPHTSNMYKEMLNIISKDDMMQYFKVKSGDEIDFDPLVSVEVMNPQTIQFEDINDNSIVLLMTYRNVSFLFTGDAGLDAETFYARKLTHVSVLKVAHHGSETATGQYLLSKIHPDVSIISVGNDNKYGHPDSSVITRLEKDGSIIYRTDIDDNIVITTNGEQYSIIE